MTSESTQTAAGETGKTDKGARTALDQRALMDVLTKLQNEVAALRSENAELRELVAVAATAAGEASAYMRVLLPEQYLALKPDEVRKLHEAAPTARLKLTADFATPMVTLRRGDVLDAGDPRVLAYADRLSVALITGGEDAGDRVRELVEQANGRQVKALVDAKRREQQRLADEKAREAREAEARAKALAEEAA